MNGEFWRKCALGAGAIICFAVTLWLALNDKSSSATITGLMTLGFVALLYLPLIDSFEAFGLKAKLRQSVNEADELVNALRAATATAAGVSYFQLAYIGRMASPTWFQKRIMLMGMDDSLRKVGISDADVAALREPMVRFLLADLYYLLGSEVDARVRQQRVNTQAQIDAKPNEGQVAPDSSLIERLTAQKSAFRECERLGHDLMSHTGITRFGAFLVKQLAESKLPEEDLAKLRPLADHLGRIGQTAWDTKQITDEAFELVSPEQPDKWKAAYFERFGEKPR